MTLEGFAASSLGCYGSSWNVTPTINRIASEGCLWDRMIATDDDPIAVFRQWCADDVSLETYRSIGSVELITDDVRLDSEEFEDIFDVVVFVDPEQMPDVSRVADSIEQTQLAQLILRAIERCRDPEPVGVLWLHSRFLSLRWDAPRDLIPVEDEEEDFDVPREEPELLIATVELPPVILPDSVPFLYEQVAPPRIVIDPDTHPDVVTAWMRTYACQIRLVDELLEFWLASVEEFQPHVVVAGTSGFALGQNGWIGHHVGPLRSSDIRLPVIVRRSNVATPYSSLRIPQVLPSPSLGIVLQRLSDSLSDVVSPEEWCRAEDSFEPAIATRSNRAMTAVTTPRWFCVDRDQHDHQTRNAVLRETSLFLKPDDVDDVNDIGRLRMDVTDQLLSIVTSSSGNSKASQTR